MDREKVISYFADYEPYARDLPAVTIKSRVYLDVLELLKEREAIVHPEPSCEMTYIEKKVKALEETVKRDG